MSETLDAAIGEELVRLQRTKNLGGFVVRDGVACRAEGPSCVDANDGPRAWDDAIRLVEIFARALGELERRLGQNDRVVLAPSDFVLGETPHLRADALVAKMLGRELAPREASPRFCPPEQSEGAPWDSAARRYVLGFVAYRLLAGAFPFARESLRRDLDDRATYGAPPFADEIARAMKPGVQSLVLSMLSPRAADRPRSADEIARACAALLDVRTPRPTPLRSPSPSPSRSRSPRPTPSPSPRPTPTPTPSRSPRVSRFFSRERWVAVAIAFSGVLALALGAFARLPDDAPEKRVPIAPLKLKGTLAQDCEGCHPREVSEWKRSVMAHASKSPLFGALESAVEEQIGKTSQCPNGAGVLRAARADACFDERTGARVTGAGGEGWCINCHAPGENLSKSAQTWSAVGSAASRAPLRDALAPASLEGISCAVCHQTIGPVGPHRANATYEGNATWTSFVTGQEFSSRPEDRASTFGIANSGYSLDPRAFRNAARDASALVHGTPSAQTSTYLKSSEFCGACHDVRLFGTDVLGATERGEHFKRLRNAYSEWRAWSDTERSRGREPATCQGCHMSQYPGVCERGEKLGADDTCPQGTRFAPRAPVVDARAVSHYFTSVEIPLTPGFPDSFATDASLDAFGAPVGLRERRDALLRHTFSVAIDEPSRAGSDLRIPLRIENVGAGHRVPAGFSQEREFWIELEVKDARGALVYRVGHLEKPDEDLGDKKFVRVTTSDDVRDGLGRPLGLFGADVIDGPDVGAWDPPPSLGGTAFRGKGLVNFQNGFLRCVRCIGTIDAEGRCQAGEGQGVTRADRFVDGAYDIDTGECRSNLSGQNALFETYFPIGALDADRGVARAPDAIIDTRSAPPGVPVVYTYLLDAAGRTGPFHVTATLHFRAFPPFLLRAFADYEARAAAKGLRPSGPQVTRDMIEKLEVIDLVRVEKDVP